jgi:hypothetical protein
LAVLGVFDGAEFADFCGFAGWFGEVAGLVGGAVGLGGCGEVLGFAIIQCPLASFDAISSKSAIFLGIRGILR